ncbi:Probable hemoglobin and hemoglobin-haptoglobin-binding protein 1 precursor [Serratia liquefaciens]|jgi:hemoglobin/transferrin/lactoferrin receptor protein|uniref:TonB-dependent receptor n=1 Tax=Serratia liquefaciens TaxID=614 RepID=A0ABX7DB60_SERLI|nr:TonB-dependent receptor [Serratia liquefaciens]OKP21233.1 TonB-dependent receptor [Serratia liquefaciens]QQU57651.1 TonB-dependent receptor [Serratia liquefaciens]CAI0842893.1 Probable hemoglobin and hemoglobin-haptoglobin-binding protein 1 precursor [Serratia liquefaciens]CAI2435436.1 Probable hemoglobin and hemoglobin-haptoglobin-binding protein 1 precursor [Serratia liquefaciens]HCR61782.1 TonB-dependent receptor [Serratia liquefaciens]
MCRTFNCRGIIGHSALWGALIASAFNANAEVKKISLEKTTQSEEEITVVAPVIENKSGTITTITAQDMQKKGGNDFGSIMRYEPLISATGVSGGSSSGKSGFDRSGYTGYNIRGLESNRVGLDVDGIPQPDATGRSYVSRAGLNTFGIGRDYIDPYMYGQVEIESGATSIERSNTSIGGAVSFLPKSADQYLSPTKQTYFGYQSDYDSSNRSWHNGITAAAGDEQLRGVFVYSRRDGQETRNNSGTHQAYPANWHTNALMASGIWQPNDEHKLTGTVDYYDKTNHTHYDSWNSAGSAILGTAQQQSNTRRWGVSLKDEWTPYNDFVDTLTSKVYYQQTQAHDNTYMPTSTGSMERVYSDYNVNTYGFETQIAKTWGRHTLSGGLNARLTDTERPFREEPAPSAFTAIMQPESDSRSYVLGGYVQDRIQFDLDGHGFAVVPGVRVAHQSTKPQNLSSLTTGSTVLTESELETLYGKSNTDTQVLPSLSFQYNLTPTLMTYLQYKRGAQFPNASQLYGSWNLGSSYAGTAQYALIGNADLNTETSNNLEWGVKGEVVEGVTLRTSLFYNTYKNFIAYTRYQRASSPDKFANVPSNIYTIYQAENRDKAYIYGGEISTRLNFGTWFEQVNGLSANFALGYNQGKSKSSYSGDKYVDIDSVAPMKAIVGVAWDDPAKRYGAAVTATFVKGKQATATNRESYNNASGSTLTDATTEYLRVPGYGLVDMSAYWQVARNVKLSGGVYNITDRKYRDYLSSRELTDSTQQDAYDNALAVMPGRTFQLGVNVDF